MHMLSPSYTVSESPPTPADEGVYLLASDHAARIALGPPSPYIPHVGIFQDVDLLDEDAPALPLGRIRYCADRVSVEIDPRLEVIRTEEGWIDRPHPLRGAIIDLVTSAAPQRHRMDRNLPRVRCSRCGLRLRTEASIARGVGPVCRRSMGGDA
jgi:hypothetical protein